MTKNLKKVHTILDASERVSKLEEKSDAVFEKAVSELFESEKDAKTILIYKEVLSSLEKATDRCKEVGHILETISIKYA